VAWPAFFVAVATGIWNVLDQDGSVSSNYNATLVIKVLLVVVAGLAAFQHSRTERRSVRALTGAVGLAIALLIMFLGVLLVWHQ